MLCNNAKLKMGDSWCMSLDWKTNDDRSDLHQKAETAIKYARWVSGAGIDVEVLVQIQKFDFWNSKNILVHFNSKFCHPQN